MKGLYQALENLVWVAQLGLNLIMPLLLCLGGCWWLNTRMGVGGWVYIIGMLLGLGGGAASFRAFARKLQKDADKPEKKPPVGFNKH